MTATHSPRSPKERGLDAAISKVVRNEACSGCGVCTLIDPGLSLKMNVQGFVRPVRESTGSTALDAVGLFKKSCPGVTVRSNATSNSERHETMGSFVGVWEGHATDPEVRFRGSSAGVLTAINQWLLETGRASRVASATAGANPRRTVPVTLTTKEEALTASGSRYAPVGILANQEIIAPNSAVTGKPCEISALRAFAEGQRTSSEKTPILMSFFCAGTPSSLATEQLVESLGFDRSTLLDSLWYRGHGWPGHFTVATTDRTARTSYEESWGNALGPTTQWRCKVCPDGVGESADISVADYWRSDVSGYPTFEERPGLSAVIARTERGLELVLAAAAAGVISLRPIDMASLADIQPLQVQRRKTLFGRLLGSIMAGRPIPRFVGFGLLRLSIRKPRTILRVARGTFRRVRKSRNT